MVDTQIGHVIQKGIALDPTLRTVTSIPLKELWTATGSLNARRGPYLTLDDVKGLLHQGSLQVVVADCGKALQWIEPATSFAFWKEEVKTHLAPPEAFSQQAFPDGYCYLASEWVISGGDSVILLEMYH